MAVHSIVPTASNLSTPWLELLSNPAHIQKGLPKNRRSLSSNLPSVPLPYSGRTAHTHTHHGRPTDCPLATELLACWTRTSTIASPAFLPTDSLLNKYLHLVISIFCLVLLSFASSIHLISISSAIFERPLHFPEQIRVSAIDKSPLSSIQHKEASRISCPAHQPYLPQPSPKRTREQGQRQRKVSSSLKTAAHTGTRYHLS